VQVRIFLLADAVTCGLPGQATPQGYYNIERMLKSVLARGGEVYNLVRGQSDPFINAWTMHDGRLLWVKAAAPTDRCYGGTPGRIVKIAEGGIIIATGRPEHGEDRGILLLQVALEDGPPVRAVDYFSLPSGHLPPGGGYLE